MRIYWITKTPTAGPGVDGGACLSIVTCAASQAQSQWQAHCCKLRCNYCLYWQSRLESCSSSSSLQRGWSARMATSWSNHRPACSIRYRSPHVSSSANDSFKTFTGPRSCRPHHSHFSHGRENRTFCSGRGDNLVIITRFGKRLFANMHHRVYAGAGALRQLNVACPHPDVSSCMPAPRRLHWITSVKVM